MWDNVSWHKNQLIRAELAMGQMLQAVHRINFPPYAPDRHPIEQVPNDTKYAISSVQLHDFESTVAAIEANTHSRIFNCRI